MKTKLLNWVKKDLENRFKVPAEYWEINHKSSFIDFETEKVKIDVLLYVNEQAYLDGASSIKTRSFVVDLSGDDFDGIKAIFLGVIKNGIESMTDYIHSTDSPDMTEVPGFFSKEG